MDAVPVLGGNDDTTEQRTGAAGYSYPENDENGNGNGNGNGGNGGNGAAPEATGCGAVLPVVNGLVNGFDVRTNNNTNNETTTHSMHTTVTFTSDLGTFKF